MSRNVNYLFVLNPKSFWHRWKKEQVIERIHTFFKKNALGGYTIYISRFPRDAVCFIPLFAREIPQETTLRVIAVGGDGILFDCLNGIIGLENVELGAIPYGHTNNFIQNFGRHSIASFKDIKRLFEAQTIPVDVMRCGSNYALGHCVIGMEAEAIRYAERIRQKLLKGNTLSRWLGRRFYTLHYFTGILAAFFDKRLFHQRYNINIDEKEFSGYCWGVPVFNSPYCGGGFRPLAAASINDGILDMLLIRGKRVLEAICVFPFYITGNYTVFPRNLLLEQGQKIRITSAEPMIISIDEAVFFERELEIEALPKKIQFIDSRRLKELRAPAGYRGGAGD